MLGREYENQVCSIASTLEVVGERWSLLIVRDVFLGLRRFEQIQADLGIARNILQRRLSMLVEHGVLEKRLYMKNPPRHEYRLTEKGIDLAPVLLELFVWSARHERTEIPCEWIGRMKQGREEILAETRRRWEQRDRTPILPPPRRARVTPPPVGAGHTRPVVRLHERSIKQR